MLLALMLCLTDCAAGTEPDETATQSSSAVVDIVDETEPVNLPKGTATKEDCALCGSHSLWGYYSKFDSIGVLNLAGGNISDLRIFEYEDDGKLKENSGSSTMMANDGDGRYSYISVTGSRGICNLSLSWDEGKEITLEEIAPKYCPDCMEKIAALDASWSDEFPEGKRCPFAMIDFTTGEIYSLNGICTACFIRDYYMNFEFDDRRIEGIVVYAPERFPK